MLDAVTCQIYSHMHVVCSQLPQARMAVRRRFLLPGTQWRQDLGIFYALPSAPGDAVLFSFLAGYRFWAPVFKPAVGAMYRLRPLACVTALPEHSVSNSSMARFSGGRVASVLGAKE